MEEPPQIVAGWCWLLGRGLPECKSEGGGVGFFRDENGMWNAADLKWNYTGSYMDSAAVPSDVSEAPPRSEDILGGGTCHLFVVEK